MNDLNYSRCKDASPADTVHRIRNILCGLGIMTIDDWADSGIDGCYSLRVTIAGTGMGSNGKGTDTLYAMASGYAELIERMQNNILYLGGMSDEAATHGGFLIAPDEKYFSYNKIAEMDNALLNYILPRTMSEGLQGIEDDSDTRFKNESEERLEAIKTWTLFNPPDAPSSVIAVPFYSIKNRSIQYLPYDMYSAIYGSNGMCAGNTPEEALVQGLSEIFERYVNKKLIADRITPPTIPDEYLMNFPHLYRIIKNIQQSGRYKVIVKDCSLGKNYPVVGTIMIDTYKGTFGMKLGVHPTFQIALERTFTEAFQGVNIENFTRSCRISMEEEILGHRDNAVNIAKTGVGCYPAQLLLDKFSYEFKPWLEEQGKPNKVMLQEMLDLLVEQGYDLLVRDASFLGFPSFQIIVPGFSEMYPADLLRTKELKTYTAMGKTLGNLNRATTAEIERIVRYIRYKQTSVIENQMNFIIGRPLIKMLPGGIAEVDFLKAVCLYKLGRLTEASRVFSSIAAVQSDWADDEYIYYNCLADYVKAKSTGLEQEELQAIIKEMYPEKVAARVIYQLRDPKDVIERIYPSFNCWDCESCNAREYCCYRETENIHNRLKEMYAANPIDQERLAEIF